MTQRWIVRGAVPGVTVATVLLAHLVAAGQTAAPSKAPGSAVVARAVDGHPDLQGVWNFSSLTPLERPAQFAEQPTLTLAEAAEYQRQVLARNNADRRDGSPDADLARAYNDAWYDRGAHMAVVKGAVRTSLIVEPPDGKVPALTPAAQQRAAARAQARQQHAADGPEDRLLGERCLQFNAGPPMLPGPYNNYVQLFQTRDHVVIVNEMIHDARVVPINGRPHLPAAIRRWQGDPVGRWDGDVFVVDSTNFTDRTNFRGASENLHLVERFSRLDADTLLYEVTVDDPSSFTKPWKLSLPMTRTSERMFEYACHEGNEAMKGILKGARAKERTGR